MLATFGMDISLRKGQSKLVRAPGKRNLSQTGRTRFTRRRTRSHVGRFQDFSGCIRAKRFTVLAVSARTGQRFLISYIIYSCSDSTKAQHVLNTQEKSILLIIMVKVGDIEHRFLCTAMPLATG